MKKNILFLILLNLFSFNVFAEDTTIWRDGDDLVTDLTESQWVMFLGAEIMRLDPITNFSLPRATLGDRTETLYGPAIGFARKWYIAGNLTTTTEPMLYYLQNDDQKAQVPSKESISSYKVSEFNEKYQYYGMRIAQSLGYTFEFDALNIEPFAQVYIGQGFNRTAIHYHWDTHIAAEHQSFNSVVNETITHQGLSAGLQLIGKNGYISFVKVSKNTLTFKKRKSRTYREVAGAATYAETSESLNTDLEKLSVTIGLGYIF